MDCAISLSNPLDVCSKKYVSHRLNIPVCIAFPKCRMCVRVSASAVLHSEVSVDITRQGLSVEQEVVADNVECQAGAPVGSRAIGRGGGTTSSSNPCRRVTVTPFLLLGFFFLTLCDHRDEDNLLSNQMPD